MKWKFAIWAVLNRQSRLKCKIRKVLMVNIAINYAFRAAQGNQIWSRAEGIRGPPRFVLAPRSE